MYSEEYDAYIEQKQDAWGSTDGGSCSRALSDSARSEAETKLADGKKQLAERKRGDKEPALMMQKTIRRCKSQIEDGEKAASDAKKKLGICPG